MKLKSLKIVNVCMLFLFLIIVLSILFYEFIPSQLKGASFLSEIHEIAGILFFIMAIFHIRLNWNWLKNQIFKKKKR
jgi:cytochrome b561